MVARDDDEGRKGRPVFSKMEVNPHRKPLPHLRMLLQGCMGYMGSSRPQEPLLSSSSLRDEGQVLLQDR